MLEAREAHRHLRARVFGVPLLIRRRELESILLGDLGVKLGIDGAKKAEHDAASGRRRVGGATILEDGVAVLPVVGTLAHRVSGMAAMSGGPTDYRALSEDFRRLRDDPSVKAILLDVDSPGGEASAVFDLADEIHAARSVKPVHAVANERALSAAYAIASSAERLTVPRTGEVGSVGVYSLHVDQSAADEKRGLVYTFVHAGAKKVSGNSHEPLTAEAAAELQVDVDRVMGLFVETVARNRNLSGLEVRATEAGVLGAEDAVANGFADQVGTFDEALAGLRAEVAEKEREMEELEALRAENENLRAEMAKLSGERDLLVSAAKERRAAEVEGYIESLKAQSAEANAPIAAAELADVRELFELGRDGVARKLGSALLKASTVASGEPFKRAGAPAPGDGKLERKRAHVATERSMLEMRGFDVETNEDESEIVSAKRGGLELINNARRAGGSR